MKKILTVLFFLSLSVVFLVPKTTVYANQQKEMEVFSNKCDVYELENEKTFETISSLEDLKKIETLNFGEKIQLLVEDVFSFKNNNGEVLEFYNIKTNSNKTGFVLSSCVCEKEKSLNMTLDPNAKVKNEKVAVYIERNDSDENKLVIDGENIFLEKNQNVKIVDGYDTGKEYCEVLFELENEIKTGFVKTEDLEVEGFNYTIILIVFIFILVASTIWAIYSATRKKRKKSKEKIKT